MQDAQPSILHDKLDVNQLKQQFQQLEKSHAAGELSDQQYQQSRLDLERRILDAVLNQEQLANQTPSSTDPAISVSPNAQEAPERAVPVSRQRGWWLGLLVLVSVAAYFWILAPKRAVEVMPPSGSMASVPMPAASGPASAASGQGPTVVDALAERLQNNPKDGEGWAMLARSYRVMGRTAEALEAYQKAQAVLGDDPALLADYAETMALSRNGNLTGEPIKLLQRAIKKDPAHIKTLYLLGQHALAEKDYALAIRQWEKALKSSPANHPQTQLLQTSLSEARRLAGLPAQPASEVKTGSAASPAESISGTVTLAESLLKQAQPQDTVFIMATPSNGSRMPIAVLRRQVKDLPIRFVLDDRLAMSPETRLSRVGRVNLSARVSQTGSVLPVKGDLTGQLTAVSIGTQDASIVIQDVVKP